MDDFLQYLFFGKDQAAALFYYPYFWVNVIIFRAILCVGWVAILFCYSIHVLWSRTITEITAVFSK